MQDIVVACGVAARERSLPYHHRDTSLTTLSRGFFRKRRFLYEQ